MQIAHYICKYAKMGFIENREQKTLILVALAAFQCTFNIQMQLFNKGGWVVFSTLVNILSNVKNLCLVALAAFQCTCSISMRFQHATNTGF